LEVRCEKLEDYSLRSYRKLPGLHLENI